MRRMLLIIALFMGYLVVSTNNGQAMPLDQVKLKVYHAPWCGWCKVYAPVVRMLKEDFHVDVERIDVTQTKVEGLKGLPATDILDKEGKLLKRVYGYKCLKDIKKLIEDL